MVGLGVCGEFIKDSDDSSVPSLLKVTRYNKQMHQQQTQSASENEEDEDDGNDSEIGAGGELSEPVVDLPSSDVIPGSTRLRRRAGWVDGSVNVPTIDLALSMHVEAAGYASSDDFLITVRGRGGHASCPHLAVNPVFVAANVITAMNALVNQGVAASHQCVLTVTRCTGGSNNNIIPDDCVLEGTLRTQDNTLRDDLCERLPLVARLTALSFGAAADVVFTRSFAAGSNAAAATRLVQNVAGVFSHKVEESDTPCMGSEDFFEFGLGGRVPAAM